MRANGTVGETAPDFTVKDFGGKRFTLSEWNGRESVLLWFTNLCDGCRSKFAEVEKFKKEYDGKGEVTTRYSGHYVPGTCPVTKSLSHRQGGHGRLCRALSWGA